MELALLILGALGSVASIVSLVRQLLDEKGDKPESRDEDEA